VQVNQQVQNRTGKYKLLSVYALLPPNLRRDFWAADQFDVEKRLHHGYASQVFQVGGWEPGGRGKGRRGDGGGDGNQETQPIRPSTCTICLSTCHPHMTTAHYQHKTNTNIC
jgi:hypothetical protein